MRIDLIQMLDYALQAAQAASEEILNMFGSGKMDVAHKGDGSPVTNADLRAHAVINKLLQASGFPVLSEEAAVSFEQRCNWQRFWLVDPLDGTKNFIARNDEFTVNIALIENGVPVIGVVAAPALNKTWYASRGGCAWQNHAGIKSHINAIAPWPVEPRMFTSCFHDVPASLEFGGMNGVVHFIPAGASSKLARLAASEAEFYPRFAGSSEWDIAAGDAILREAGGMLRTISGEVPSYNKQSLRNPYFIAWRPPFSWHQIRLPVDYHAQINV